ncbi:MULTISPECIES: hypothetical protein [Spirulina sp. CCY15215]|uniref:hypothetical protein n=1 Tax=Spirulina sp. CCY15215 TaxID=2767591 RepID=UPI001950AED3|nr:hypothetical protein [Spirulina major]
MLPKAEKTVKQQSRQGNLKIGTLLCDNDKGDRPMEAETPRNCPKAIALIPPLEKPPLKNLKRGEPKIL